MSLGRGEWAQSVRSGGGRHTLQNRPCLQEAATAQLQGKPAALR